MQPQLCIVIAAYNAEDTLGTQLDALVGQAPDLAWEVVVCDNRSTDGTAVLADRYRDRLALRVVPAHGGRGGAYARNVGVAAGTAPWLGFVDADDEVAPDWVEAVADGLRRHRFIAGRFDGARLNLGRTVRSRPLQQSTGLQMWDVGPGLPHAGGGNMAIHRAVYETVGGFDEHLVGLQDVDFCWRVQLAGAPLVFWPQALLHVRLRSGLRAMWTQAVNYGAAQAELEARYASVTRDDVPDAVRRPAPPPPPRVRRGQGLVDVASSLRDPGQFLWQVGWHVGHRRAPSGQAAREAPTSVV